MPEGDTIHKLARYFAPWLPGQHVACCETGRAPERSRDLSVVGVEAVGKHLLMRFRTKHDDASRGREHVLRTHLGMWGSWQQIPLVPKRPGNVTGNVTTPAATSTAAHRLAPAHSDQLRIDSLHSEADRVPGQVEAALLTRFRRRANERVPPVVLWLHDRILVCWQPKEVEWLPCAASRSVTLATRAGLDLTARSTRLRACDEPGFWPTFVRTLRASTAAGRPVLDVLLDQRLASGIGNVYKSELLFLHKLHPCTPLDQVADDVLAALYADAQRLLERNLGFGPRITRERAEPGEHLFVYGRRDLPCRACGNPIRYRRWGEHLRSTYFCPICQPSPDARVTESAANGDDRRMDRRAPSAAAAARRQHRRARSCS